MRDNVAIEFLKRIEANQLKPDQFLTGCDWSHWQPPLLDADMSDYHFFIHKITEGRTFIDDQCKRRILSLCDNKPCICYHFLNDKYSGQEQAAHFINTMKSFFAGKRLGFCVDFEIAENTDNVDKLRNFVKYLLQAGYTPFIYCGDYSKGLEIAKENNLPLWIARWRNKRPINNCKLWQFNNTPYDLDLFFGTMPELLELLQWV